MTWWTALSQRFLSTLSLRRATHYGWSWYDDFTISIHALLAESDCGNAGIGTPHFYFYPRSPCGERPSRLHKILADWDFYPRSPCGERLCKSTLSLCACLFLSTLSLRRATGLDITVCRCHTISIHALLAESDISFRWYLPSFLYFYPRSPCGERHHRTDQLRQA